MQLVEHPPRWRVFGLGALLVALALAAYSNSFTAPLVLDDALNIANNASIRRWWSLEPASAATLRGRPVVNFSYALNYALAGGAAVRGYHVVNFLIHAAAGLTLLGIIRRTLRLPRFQGRFENSADFLAFAGAVLWALHPLLTETVTYLSQRTESLMGLFYLLTLYCFIRGAGSDRKKRLWFLLAVSACLLGMGCKEVMVTAPVVVLLYDRTFLAGTFAQAWRLRRGFYLGLAGSWVILPVAMFDLHQAGVGFDLGLSPLKYAFIECRVVMDYLRLAIWPANLVFDYGSIPVSSLADVWPQALLLSGIIVGGGLALKFRPVLGFLVAWPFLILAPTSSIVPVANQPMAEHRMYLPLAGLVLLAVMAGHRLLGRLAWVPLLLAIAGLGVAAHQRNAVYRDPLVLWKDTVAKRPGNDRAQLNLGGIYLHAGQLAAAEKSYEDALKANRYCPEAVIHLALIYAQTGRTPKAIDFFDWASILVPTDAEAHYNLGCLFLSGQKTAEARAQFERALQLNPQHSQAHNNLAIILMQAGEYRAAVAHYSQALLSTPDDPEIYANRANACYHAGLTAAAIADYQQALKLRPDFEDARKNLQTLQQLPPSP